MRIAVGALVEMHCKLRVLGAPVATPSIVCGDNMSVVLNTTLPPSALKKKHNAIARHRVREAAAAGVVGFICAPTAENIADCATKNLSPMAHSKLAKPCFARSDEGESDQGECQDGTKAETQAKDEATKGSGSG